MGSPNHASQLIKISQIPLQEELWLQNLEESTGLRCSEKNCKALELEGLGEHPILTLKRAEQRRRLGKRSGIGVSGERVEGMACALGLLSALQIPPGWKGQCAWKQAHPDPALSRNTKHPNVPWRPNGKSSSQASRCPDASLSPPPPPPSRASGRQTLQMLSLHVSFLFKNLQ